MIEDIVDITIMLKLEKLSIKHIHATWMARSTRIR